MLKDLDHLLEQLPLWKRLRSIPAEVDAMKARIAELEGALAAVGERCPSCGRRTWFVESSVADKTFGDLGGNRRKYKCRECGFTESRVVA